MKRERHEHNNHIENEEENNNNDIISDLPDSVLLHILSFLKTKDAVKTCILSTRWKNLWKHLSILTLYSSHFKTLRDFFKFVSRILFLRDDSTAIHTLDLHRRGIIEPHLLKKIIKYAVSHNVQQLEIDVGCDIQHFPTCLFSCQTLTSLHLYVRHRISGQRTLFPNSLNLPSLTNLSLDSFAFPIENEGRANPFSAMKRLNNLIIDDCIVLDAQKLCISSDRLTDLTIQTTFERCFCEIELSTPSLCTFDFTGIPYQKLRGSHLSSIKQVNFDANIMENPTKPPSVLLSWLLELTGIKSLRVTSTTLQVLSLVPNLLKVEFPSLCNLKSLKVKRKEISYELSKSLLDANFAKLPTGASYTDVVKLWETFSEGSSSIPDGIVDFLLQNSPSAEVDIIN